MKKVFVVTVNYNTEYDTKNLLKSFEKIHTSGFSVDIIIVDNNSTNPFSLSENEKKETITLIRLDKNTGFVGGYNAGIKEALKRHADYIMIVNNDTIMDPNMIKNLLEVLDSDPKIGVTTPKIYFAKGHEFHKDRYTQEELGKVFWFAGGYMDWNNVISLHRGVDEVDHGQYDKIEKTDFASGCCMLFKREVLEKVGLFDERYFLYYEDADLNQRIEKAGYAIYYVPTAVLVHINASSSGGAGNKLHDYYLTRNQMLFGMTYAPFKTKFALLRQSLRLLFTGRPYQKQAIRDYYLGRLGKGTYI
ncbi:MAG TPA: glycosyltransferase family 2 protein [Patescibacteria group bacterium]|nr:glycosyltransferase family 2 protein [Patescibacteria group bacterium]